MSRVSQVTRINLWCKVHISAAAIIMCQSYPGNLLSRSAEREYAPKYYDSIFTQFNMWITLAIPDIYKDGYYLFAVFNDSEAIIISAIHCKKWNFRNFRSMQIEVICLVLDNTMHSNWGMYKMYQALVRSSLKWDCLLEKMLVPFFNQIYNDHWQCCTETDGNRYITVIGGLSCGTTPSIYYTEINIVALFSRNLLVN